MDFFFRASLACKRSYPRPGTNHWSIPPGKRTENQNVSYKDHLLACQGSRLVGIKEVVEHA